MCEIYAPLVKKITIKIIAIYLVWIEKNFTKFLLRKKKKESSKWYLTWENTSLKQKKRHFPATQAFQHVGPTFPGRQLERLLAPFYNSAIPFVEARVRRRNLRFSDIAPLYQSHRAAFPPFVNQLFTNEWPCVRSRGRGNSRGCRTKPHHWVVELTMYLSMKIVICGFLCLRQRNGHSGGFSSGSLHELESYFEVE